VASSCAELRINSERLLKDFEQLSEIGATFGGGVSRLALSNEDLAARSWFADRIEEAGLKVRDDEVGNLSGLLFAADRDAKTLMIGSHLDTVPNGGRYDGAIGVLIALDRQEKLDGEETAFTALQTGLGVPVRSIATLQDVISWLDSAGAGIGERDVLAASIRAYRDRYCVLDS